MQKYGSVQRNGAEHLLLLGYDDDMMQLMFYQECHQGHDGGAIWLQKRSHTTNSAANLGKNRPADQLKYIIIALKVIANKLQRRGIIDLFSLTDKHKVISHFPANRPFVCLPAH